MEKKIILVHGLGTTSQKTWGKFPTLLENDQDIEYSIINHGYNSPGIFKIFTRAPSLNNLADGLLTRVIETCDLQKDNIILAGHSLGGLVVKKMLLKLRDKQITHNIHKICFFDVPHDGSAYANIGKYIALRNRHLRILVRDSSELDDLNDQWCASKLDQHLMITSIIADNDDVVSSSSSKSILRGHNVSVIPNTNHSTIVKPQGYEDLSYISFKNFILSRNNLNAFKIPASRSLHDWKRIDRRDHSFPFVNDQKRDDILQSLKKTLESGKCAIRITGASGLGKSRLILEAIESSESISPNSVLVFEAEGYEKDIRYTVRRAVEANTDAIFIVENCSVTLNNQLSAELSNIECSLRLITIGYADEQIDDSIYINIPPLSDESIENILKPILIDLQSYEISRIAKFAQGYPLIAVLVAKQYQEYGHIGASLEQESVLKKLIDPDGDLSIEERRVLVACAIFDVFGTTGLKAEDEAKFIALDLAGSSLFVFDKVISHFSKRQIIHRIGRYARVIPKPLALTLAADWWREAQDERKKELIKNLPDSMVESFCTQVAYLDNEPSVQKFSNQLFGGSTPFVNAEELLSERGSKFFRTFVEVNPLITSKVLYRTLVNLEHEKLVLIEGDIRRNLLMALEKLCFHEHIFLDAAWCFLLFSYAENESWSNNATAMFSQLFRIRMSGTSANPDLRFRLLNRGLELNLASVDLVLIEALNSAISLGGESRMVGAEYQGTKAALTEWEPRTWQDIFNYWNEAIAMLLLMLTRGEEQKEKALAYLGISIRNLAIHGQDELIEKIINECIKNNGLYWPEALLSLQNFLEYDKDKVPNEMRKKVEDWLKELTPDNADLDDKLKIIVVNPPWHLHKDKDGNIIDTAEENAKQLAINLSKEVESLKEHLEILLSGEQNQSSKFGYTLGKNISLKSHLDLINQCVETLVKIENQNCNFLLGLSHALFERKPEAWEELLEQIFNIPESIELYPLVMRTGELKKIHLDKLLVSIKNGLLTQGSADGLGYGRVTAHLTSNEIASFTINLSKLGERASWSALNIVYMYCYSNKEAVDEINTEIKQILTTVKLGTNQKSNAKNVHHWRGLSERVLNKPDADFALELLKQLLFECKNHGLDHADLWSDIKPFLLNLMEKYYDILWPELSNTIIHAESLELYWLAQLLDRENSSVHTYPSIFKYIPTYEVIKWCKKYPEKAPFFVARCLNFFDITPQGKKPSKLLIDFLREYGHNDEISNELYANFATRSWSGSLISYLQEDKEGLEPLTSHPEVNVSLWINNFIFNINKQIEHEKERDGEFELGLF